ncbi:MAG: uroporphyrinogen decarboxylase, partial [bacterium]|nr:uroporphyrinogen decarboxylase [bacterium]
FRSSSFCYQYAGDPCPMSGLTEHFRDDFGVVWNRSGADKDIGVIDKYQIQEPDVSTYTFPPIDAAAMHERYRALENGAGDAFVVGGIGFSMFERAWTLRGMQNLLTDMLINPDFVDDLLDAICDFNLKIIDLGLTHKIDGFYFGDDWGKQSGLIMGPELWRRFVKPRVARMYARVREAGKFVIQHSCGDIREIFPDVIEIGLNVYQTFQPEIYDIAKVKREFGKDLSFWGGISTQRLLPFATPAEIRRKIGETLAIMRPHGGYILAPTHALPGDIPAENIVAMIEAFKNQAGLAE